MYHTVLFDLDGTILDTNELIIQSFLHTFEGLTEEPLTRQRIIGNMGRALVDQMQEISGDDDVAHWVTKYRKHNLDHHDRLVTTFPYVRETVAALHAAGVKLGVVTSKVRLTSEKGLKLCGLWDYFEVIITVDDVERPKPDPEGVLKALYALDSKPKGALMVGDSSYDIHAAQRAGMDSVAVSWSLKGVDYLRQFHLTYLIDDIRELLQVVGIADARAGEVTSIGGQTDDPVSG